MATQLYVVIFPNGKRYFGITGATKLSQRERAHRGDARRGSHLPIHAALRKYGEAAVFHTLEVGEREHILAREIEIIAVFSTRDGRYGYNATDGGEGATARIVSQDSRQKMRDSALRNPPLSPEAREKIRRALTGIKRSSETCAKISAAHKGKIVSTESRERIRAAAIGRKASEATRAKMRARQTSLETRAKISAARMGHPTTAETRAKIAKAHFGRRNSEETLAKMRARITSDETREKMRASADKDRARILGLSNRGRNLSAETRAKISAVLSGRRVSDETREKIRATRLSEEFKAKPKAHNPGHTGHKHSEEAKAKMRKAVAAALARKEKQET